MSRSRLTPPASRWLDGCDDTPGIVSVEADATGRARVWRRVGGRVELSEERFPTWFLARRLDLLAHLPTRYLGADELRAAHGSLPPPDGDTLVVVPLEGADEDTFGYLVLAASLVDVEAALLDAWNKRFSQQASSLAELRGAVAVWPPDEQYLILRGRTFYRGLAYPDLRRLQFDLETTGLNEHRDHIFMISMRDSTGWEACLDASSIGEAALIQAFVELVHERDPDVLENHNIFAFDLSFLVRRAASLGVRLALGRDGSEPRPTDDLLHTGDRTEPFTRWSVAGREVVDTLHAVKRHASVARDLRRYGLKEAARFFGFAKPDREYVPGAEVWPTFQQDPDRIRRYARDDVLEVDGLSVRLMPTLFALASRVPRRYERLVTRMTPAALLDPLLVRAYLHEGQALPAPPATPPSSHPPDHHAQLFVTGVVRRVLRIAVAPLAPHAIVQQEIRPRADRLGVFPALLGTLLAEQGRLWNAARDPLGSARERDQSATQASGLEELANTWHPYLATPSAIFADAAAAAAVGRACRAVVDRLVAQLDAAGATLVEIDGDRLTFGVPEAWGEADERQLLLALEGVLPEGVHVREEGRYQALYAHAARSHILLGHDGGVSLVGGAFRSRRQERYGEHFVREAAPLVLTGDVAGLRQLFLDTVARLRARQVPVEDLCTLATVRRSPAEYRRSERREEAYEVLLAAGLKSWRAGQRVRYFRDRTGTRQLLLDGAVVSAAEADVEHYVLRLRDTYCHQFARAFRAEDFGRVFRVPEAAADPAASPGQDLQGVCPISEPVSASGRR